MTVGDASARNPGRQRWRRSGAVVPDLIVGILVIVAIVGAVGGKLFVTALCGLVLVLAVVSRAWARLALVEVDYQCHPTTDRLVVGESFELTLSVENRNRCPCPG